MNGYWKKYLVVAVAGACVAGPAAAQGQRTGPAKTAPGARPAPVEAKEDAGGAGKAAAQGPVENLRKDWKAMPGHGKWTAVSDTEVQQSMDDIKDKNTGNTGFNRAIEQSGVMEYAWSLKAASLTHGCGFFVMATDGDKDERGDAYLLCITSTPKTTFGIMKVTGNQPPVEQAKFPVKVTPGKFIDLKARYDSATGQWTLSCNGKEAGKWKDPQPYKQGGFVSFTTCLTKANIKGVSITKVD